MMTATCVLLGFFIFPVKFVPLFAGDAAGPRVPRAPDASATNMTDG